MIQRIRGFTLVELITTLVILTIVSIGITGFIRSSLGIFTDVTVRDQLLGDSRFVIERITREVRNAIPSSVRINGNNTTHCIQFVPIEYSTFYTSLPLQPSNDTDLGVVELGDINGNAYSPVNGITRAFVYPTRAEDVYDTTRNRSQLISACTDDGADSSCTTLDDPNNSAELTVSDAYATSSPAQRVYFGSVAHSYCVSDGNIYFYQDSISTVQPIYAQPGVLMAQYIVNTLSNNPASQTAGSDDPFRIVDASLLSNSIVQLRLRFERNEEFINYNHEIHVANVP